MMPIRKLVPEILDELTETQKLFFRANLYEINHLEALDLSNTQKGAIRKIIMRLGLNTPLDTKDQRECIEKELKLIEQSDLS